MSSLPSFCRSGSVIKHCIILREGERERERGREKRREEKRREEKRREEKRREEKRREEKRREEGLCHQ